MLFDKINLSAKRGDGESFENYKKRRKLENWFLRRYLRGAYIWTGDMGPAVRAEPPCETK